MTQDSAHDAPLVDSHAHVYTTDMPLSPTAWHKPPDNGRTWVKLSAGYRLESPQIAQDCARALLAHAGPERLLWGSDWPFAAFENSMRYEYAIAHFKQWVPDANMRRIIGGETAFRLYFT
jgi:predicted TIM-barrel fold metal-dependent hydrolase